jgi:hypothetical protein
VSTAPDHALSSDAGETYLPGVSDSRRVIQAILLAGLVAGVLDIADALTFTAARGGSPTRVLQYIASGVLGQDSFQGGASTAALGLFLHFVIATGAAAVFVAASLQLPVLLRRPFLWGPIYGIVVLIVMNRVVVPLSLVRRAPLALNAGFINLVAAHIFCVGIPIAFVASRMLLVRRTR